MSGTRQVLPEVPLAQRDGAVARVVRDDDDDIGFVRSLANHSKECGDGDK